MTEKKCKKCGTTNKKESKFCKSCGIKTKSTILQVFAWLFGLIYLIDGFVYLREFNLFRALIAFGIGSLLTPPISEKITNKYKWSLKQRVWVTIILILLMGLTNR